MLSQASRRIRCHLVQMRRRQGPDQTNDRLTVRWISIPGTMHEVRLRLRTMVGRIKPATPLGILVRTNVKCHQDDGRGVGLLSAGTKRGLGTLEMSLMVVTIMTIALCGCLHKMSEPISHLTTGETLGILETFVIVEMDAIPEILATVETFERFTRLHTLEAHLHLPRVVVDCTLGRLDTSKTTVLTAEMPHLNRIWPRTATVTQLRVHQTGHPQPHQFRVEIGWRQQTTVHTGSIPNGQH